MSEEMSRDVALSHSRFGAALAQSGYSEKRTQSGLYLLLLLHSKLPSVSRFLPISPWSLGIDFSAIGVSLTLPFRSSATPGHLMDQSVFRQYLNRELNCTSQIVSFFQW